MAERQDREPEDKPGQPAPKRFQPPPEVSRQSDDPAEPEEIDVMVHNKPQPEQSSSPLDGIDEDAFKHFGRDDDEDLDAEEAVEKQLRRSDEQSDRG